MVNCNLGQNKMEQKTPLTLAAQTPPPPPSTSSKSRAETARTPKQAIYIVSLILDFFMGWGAGQRVDVNFPFILSEFVGQSGYWVRIPKVTWDRCLGGTCALVLRANKSDHLFPRCYS